MAADVKMVTLRDGSQVAEPIYNVTYSIIEKKWNSFDLPTMLTLIELVRKSRDPYYETPNIGYWDRLREMGFLEPDGSVTEDIRRIAVNCFEGEGMKMRIINPLKPERVVAK